ncbi:MULTISPECIES: glycosyltransferase [Veillonella]|uniref:Galactosyldiacylglycerol synthase n=1 Tax=Veillonella denticariosi JCM 15641 TaxID=1298594 RepID=A0A2S7Z8U9_9FIRM|nr:MULTISPECIES: glycosyltransferase [Veillonella]ETS93359.1 monogalactosyldiacylglycerol synthase, C-terminal domain protein [Veillonella sp. AS16]PQL19517.1 galactosyldiacylglycerol synthase [Veillonella denticariosi JCM 15641]
MNNDLSRKVLIVSASIGTGHMQAARAIEEYWKDKEPQATISHVDFLDTETMSVEHLIKGTYIKMIDVFPMLYDIIYRVSKGEKQGSIMQTALSYLLKGRMLKLIQQEEPDVMVFTHPFPCGAASILKRQGHINMPLVAIMTDFSSHQFWLYPQVDTYFVATEGMVSEMVQSGIDESRIHVSGIPVRRSFFRDAIEDYSLEKPVKVLVMGGGLGLGSLETALKHLDDVNGIDEITVVAGQNTSLYESLVTLSTSMKTKTTVFGYTSNISELMKTSSLLVTKPGALTCMEAVTIGLPMVFFNAIPGQEEANAELLEQRGCARWARDIHNLEDVVAALLINPPRLQQMSQRAREWQVDGAAEIVNDLIKILDDYDTVQVTAIEESI